jgi:hypothetical protein
MQILKTYLLHISVITLLGNILLFLDISIYIKKHDFIYK